MNFSTRWRCARIGPTTEERKLARAVIRLAAAGGMPDSYWPTDQGVRLACKVLGWSLAKARAWGEKQ